MIKIFSSIRSTYRAVNAAIDSEHIFNDISRNLELVRTCHQDLQHLINSRNELLEFLKDQPQSLERLDTTIEKVHRGMLDAYRIMETYRPEVHSGKVSLQNQMAWANRDSKEFRTLGPVISQHHAAVLAETTFLRSCTLLTTKSDSEKPRESIVSDDKTVFENMELLDSFMSDTLVPPDVPTTPKSITKVYARASMPNLLVNQTYCDLPEPVVPNLIPHQQPTTSSHVPEHVSSLWTPNEESRRRSHGVVLNQTDHSGLSLLFSTEPDSAPDISPKIQSYYLQTQSGDSMSRSSIPPSSFSSFDRDALLPSPSVHHSLISRPSTLSLGSQQRPETQRDTSPELEIGHPHVLSVPRALSTVKAQTSLSIFSTTFQNLQRSHPGWQLIPFEERYTNMSGSRGLEDQQFQAWRPIGSDDIYELQGSGVAQEPLASRPSVTDSNIEHPHPTPIKSVTEAPLG